MSIWGTGPFDNSEAMMLCDAIADHGEPLAFLRETLQAAVDHPDPLDLATGFRTVAASHLLALELGYGESEPPGECRPPLWGIKMQEAENHRTLGLQAMARVLEKDSALLRLWERRGAEFQAWFAQAKRLHYHLGAPSGTPNPPRPFWE